MKKRKLPDPLNDDDTPSFKDPTPSLASPCAIETSSQSHPNDDFRLGQVPILKDPARDPATLSSAEKPSGIESRMVGAMYRELDDLISSFVTKYAVGNIKEIEKELSVEQKIMIITSLKGYCAPLSWRTFKEQLPESVYQELPALFAHAMISKNLHDQVLCNPFYHLEEEYTPSYIGEPLHSVPPVGTSSYLNFLWREMVFARRKDALKCRKYLLRCLYIENEHTSNNPMWGYNARLKENAQKILVDKLLKNTSLRLLLKDKQPTYDERKDVARLYSMADALCSGMYLRSKDMQFRYWRTFPLYVSQSKLMELTPASEAAELATKTDCASKTLNLQRRFVILILRPTFSFLTVEPHHYKYPRRDENERVLCKASVVITKTEAPLEGGVFSNLPDDVRKEYEEGCWEHVLYYDKDIKDATSFRAQLGIRCQLPGTGTVGAKEWLTRDWEERPIWPLD
ncbi:hypothetical protein BJX64DRAFT_287625 [Aspergillus heterothallicus]